MRSRWSKTTDMETTVRIISSDATFLVITDRCTYVYTNLERALERVKQVFYPVSPVDDQC